MLPRFLFFVLLVMLGRFADAQSMDEPSRGELLYSNHCIACHNQQVHWRDKRLVRDWTSLRQEVHRWQKTAGLGWNEEDVVVVAQFLNLRYYHFPVP